MWLAEVIQTHWNVTYLKTKEKFRTNERLINFGEIIYTSNLCWQPLLQSGGWSSKYTFVYISWRRDNQQSLVYMVCQLELYIYIYIYIYTILAYQHLVLLMIECFFVIICWIYSINIATSRIRIHGLWFCIAIFSTLQYGKSRYVVIKIKLATPGSL